MSVHVLSWVLQNSEAEGSARLVLIVLADHAHHDGTNSYPAVNTIQREARLKSRRTVQQVLRRLEESGQIVAEGKMGQGQTRWKVVMGGAQNMQGGAFDDTEGGRKICAQTVPIEVQKEPSSPAREVWDTYVELMKPRRTEFDYEERRVIEAALKVASMEECKRAIVGCTFSDVHMGRKGIDGATPKPYKKLTNILKSTKRRTTREQIDFFLEIAEKHADDTGQSSASHATINEHKRNVLNAHDLAGSGQAQKLGDESERKLKEHGIVVARGASGRPTFERRDEPSA